MKAVQLDADRITDSKLTEITSELQAPGVWRTPTVELVDLPDPTPGPDDIVIRPLVAGIGDDDRRLVSADSEGYLNYAGELNLPCVPGQEFAGFVEATGGHVTNVRVGDYVTAEAFQWCGECTACRATRYEYCQSHEELGRTIAGAYAEQVCVASRFCWPINPLIERFGVRKGCEMGALVLPLARIYNAMFASAGGFLPGECVCVYGSGLLSLASVALARAAGAGQILLFADVPTVTPLACRLGASGVFGTADLAAIGRRPHQIVMEATADQGAKVQIETSGKGNALMGELEKSLALMGKIVTPVSQVQPPETDLEQFIFRQARIQPVLGHVGHGIFPNLIELLKNGAVDITPAIMQRISLSKVPSEIVCSASRNERSSWDHSVMSEVDEKED